ncbi:MAG: response regulator transcription factor [Bacteroidales bacterium]|nr:response regulator transcription factor [Bacteroidales bacterium]
MEPGASVKKILLVDDHQMFIDGLQTMLKSSNEFDVIGEALNGEMALDFLKSNTVDIVITDINMPQMSGTELTKELKQKYSDVKVLVLSMYNEREIIHEIIMSEAEGYILKNTGKKELLEALGKISTGGTYYCNEVMQIIAGNYRMKEKKVEKTKQLTAREIEIIQLICEENSTPEIAELLHISPLTVETHRKNIMKKTSVKTIVGLIKFAIENGLAGE